MFTEKGVPRTRCKFRREHPCRSRTSAWVLSCKVAAYFHNTFLLEHFWMAASDFKRLIWNIFTCIAFWWSFWCNPAFVSRNKSGVSRAILKRSRNFAGKDNWILLLECWKRIRVFAYIFNFISICLKRKANDINDGIKYSIFDNCSLKEYCFGWNSQERNHFYKAKKLLLDLQNFAITC